MARYLYADSDPFPYEYDFLATLRGFLACASECLVAISEIERIRDQLKVEAEEGTQAIEHFDSFGADLSRSIDQMVRRGSAGGLVEDVAREIQATAIRLIHDAKIARRTDVTRLQEQAASAIEAQRAVIRQSVALFFKQEQVDFERSRFRLSLEDGHYVMRAVCEAPTNVEIAYRLDVERSDGWGQPRKVSDIVGDHMELQVGMKKKFLARDLTREIVRIDDYYVANADLDPDRAEVRLRKKPDAPDQFVLHMQREDGESSMEIVRPVGDDPSPFPAVPDDAAKLELLWAELERAAEKTLAHRKSVDWVRIDGKDLYEHDLVALMIDRFVDLYAPIVAEISGRSASDKELSLKRELANGRREEVYLRKDDLAELLSPLQEDKLRLFTRLDVFPTVSFDID